MVSEETQQLVKYEAASTKKVYIGGTEYANNISGKLAPSRLQTEEGHILPRENWTETSPLTKYVYYYTLSDHLGNARLVMNDDQDAEVVQSNSYSAFGLLALGPDVAAGKFNNRFYNGKEKQEGTGWLDYGARMYYSELGRWMTIDPMAEADESFSPFQYGGNNPISNIDLFGLTDVNGDGTDDGTVLPEVTVTAKRNNNESSLNNLQTSLDVIGIYPGAGTVAGIVNAGIDIYRGNYGSAGFNLLSAVPLLGTAMKGTKLATLGVKAISSMAKMKAIKAAIFAVRWNYGGMPKIKGYQLHHLIPESLVKKFGNEFKAAGFNVNEGFNLKYLEDGFHTKHKQYTDRVSEKLQEIINNTGGLTKQDILNVSQDMRTMVGDAYNDWKNLGGPKLNEAFR